jgi:hypothetical protein
MAIGYNPRIVTDGLVLALDAGNTKSFDIIPVKGQQEYTTPGTYSWTCPAGITSVSAVCVGGGGAGGARGTHLTNGSSAQGGYGGGLGWKNNISVTPGQTYTVVVGSGGQPPISNSSDDEGGDGGDSYFVNATTVKGGGGDGGLPGSDSSVVFQMAGAGYVGDGGGYGGRGGVGQDFTGSPNNTSGGGGGAGGYSGNGGDGGDADAPNTYTSGDAGSGGAGGGGSSAGISGAGHRIGAGGGGGVGLLGEGSSGTYTSIPTSGSGTYGGKGGSGGADAADNPWSSGNGYLPGSDGGLYGGGGGGQGMSYGARPGAGGAVRIMWGPGRSYPSTNTGNVTPRTEEDNNTWIDLSGSTDGTLTNGPTYSSNDGGALVFNGIDGYVDTTSGWKNFGTDPFTIEVWYKTSSASQYETLVGNASGGAGTFQLDYNGSNNLRFQASTNSGEYVDSSISLSVGVWKQVVIVREGTGTNQFKIYSNGDLNTTGTFNINLISSAQLRIGRNRGGIYYYDGEISNVKAYKGKALTATEVAQNFNALRGRFGI